MSASVTPENQIEELLLEVERVRMLQIFQKLKCQFCKC